MIEEFGFQKHQVMHKRVERKAPPQQSVPTKGLLADPFQKRVGMYLDNILGEINHLGKYMDLFFPS